MQSNYRYTMEEMNETFNRACELLMGGKVDSCPFQYIDVNEEYHICISERYTGSKERGINGNIRLTLVKKEIGTVTHVSVKVGASDRVIMNRFKKLVSEI